MKELQNQLLEDIRFISDKLKKIRTNAANADNLDIKKMADYHRYAETIWFLTQTLDKLKGAD